jgi:hypothetical protein
MMKKTKRKYLFTINPILVMEDGERLAVHLKCQFSKGRIRQNPSLMGPGADKSGIGSFDHIIHYGRVFLQVKLVQFGQMQTLEISFIF